MLNPQNKMTLSPYSGLYDLIVSKDNIFRRMAEEIDYSFIYDELKDKYSPSMGRDAVNPIQLFKYLIIKISTNLSDVDVVENVRVNMAYKYFLGMAPEERPIDASLLSVFRRQRLKDKNVLDLLINQSVKIALEKNIIKKRSDIIVDSTHTVSPFQHYKPLDFLKERSKKVRQMMYLMDEANAGKIEKDHDIKDVKDELQYAKALVADIKENYSDYLTNPKFAPEFNKLDEAVGDVEDHYTSSVIDRDARLGHKTKDSDFFGYKTHIAITPERIVTAAVVSSGEKGDSDYATELIEKTESAGVQVDAMIGDGAYATKDILSYANDENRDDKITVVAPLHPFVFNGCRNSEDKLDFNKDASMPICKAGHLAVKQRKVTYKKDGCQRIIFYFDKNKCECCRLRETCNPQLQVKSYSIAVHTKEQERQMKFQESELYKTKMKERYKIEAKNAEAKMYGYDRADSYGIEAMNVQAAVTMFFLNIKRIFKLSEAAKR